MGVERRVEREEGRAVTVAGGEEEEEAEADGLKHCLVATGLRVIISSIGMEDR
jgi:hypothetical protein